MPVRQRNLWYQKAALVYLSAAVMSLLLPASARLGLWLPLHLTVAGAVTVAISGAMQVFARTLTATPEPPRSLAWTQFGAAVGGAAAIAVGLPTDARWLVALGGAAWTAGIAMLGWLVWIAWSRSVTRRHPVPLAAYGLAIVFALVGGAIGATLGRGGLNAETFVTLVRIHPTVNVLGFASLTIVGTMVTLLPTVLRVRMVAWRGGTAVGLLAAGVAAQAVGWALDVTWVVGAGGLVEAAGAVAFGALVVRTLRTGRRWAAPTAALHLVSGVVWFVVGSIWYANRLLVGSGAVAAGRDVFLAVFICGWLVQVLLGAWSYLLPMLRPGSPDSHRTGLQLFELLGRTQVVAFDVGVALLVVSGLGWLPEVWSRAGWTLALAATIWALAKAWAFPWTAGVVPAGARARAVWGG